MIVALEAVWAALPRSPGPPWPPRALPGGPPEQGTSWLYLRLASVGSLGDGLYPRGQPWRGPPGRFGLLGCLPVVSQSKAQVGFTCALPPEALWGPGPTGKTLGYHDLPLLDLLAPSHVRSRPREWVALG